MSRPLRLAAVALPALCLFAAAAWSEPLREARGVWLNAASTARAGETAEQTAARLASHGFNLVFINYAPDSQPLRDLIAACRRHHLETHLWLFRPKVEVKAEWRCQSYDESKQTLVPGQACLCEEAYLAACEERVRQIVREYDVDGLHFDEVGFSRPWQCLCPRCQRQFAADTHATLSHWPDDVIRVSQATRRNLLDPAAWRGPQFDAFLQWRCRRLALYLKRLCDAGRSVRPLTVSYAVMPEISADALCYGEDLAELAKVFDFLVPMSYYTEYGGMSQGRPEWTAETCQALADWAHRGNPRCRVYAGISAYGADGGWREPVRDLFQRLVAAGTLTADQQREHMRYTTCKQAFESLDWLRAEGKISAEEYAPVAQVVDRQTPTSAELLRAVSAVRQAGLPGLVFFRYECMFEDRPQGVIGADLWDRLGEAFATPATLPQAP